MRLSILFHDVIVPICTIEPAWRGVLERRRLQPTLIHARTDLSICRDNIRRACPASAYF